MAQKYLIFESSANYGTYPRAAGVQSFVSEVTGSNYYVENITYEGVNDYCFYCSFPSHSRISVASAGSAFGAKKLGYWSYRNFSIPVLYIESGASNYKFMVRGYAYTTLWNYSIMASSNDANSISQYALIPSLEPTIYSQGTTGGAYETSFYHSVSPHKYLFRTQYVKSSDPVNVSITSYSQSPAMPTASQFKSVPKLKAAGEMGSIAVYDNGSSVSGDRKVFFSYIYDTGLLDLGSWDYAIGPPEFGANEASGIGYTKSSTSGDRLYLLKYDGASPIVYKYLVYDYPTLPDFHNRKTVILSLPALSPRISVTGNIMVPAITGAGPITGASCTASGYTVVGTANSVINEIILAGAASGRREIPVPYFGKGQVSVGGVSTAAYAGGTYTTINPTAYSFDSMTGILTFAASAGLASGSYVKASYSWASAAYYCPGPSDPNRSIATYWVGGVSATNASGNLPVVASASSGGVGKDVGVRVVVEK